MLYNAFFFYITVFFYAVAGGLFITHAAKKRDDLFSYAKQWLLVASVSGLFFLLVRFKEGGHLPLVTLFEITFFYAWMITILYIVFIREEMAPFIRGAALSIVYIILIWNGFMDKGIPLLNPLLDSFWLGIHVPVAILSYSAFALSFAISLYYIIAGRKGLPLKGVDALNLWLIKCGALLLAVCIITGGIWARSAWGRFWSWDPKETWALITFLIYAGVILLCKLLKLNPKWRASLSVAGFTAMLFTFFGVSLLMQSHHAY